ncbi:hypothetical protein [Croceicoccus naphthovorans]|uniref:HTH marR-type domain-containing protein n=2 Tax=Croceicoccus naphthovorans TaxID=1348774 RepID=A0A0G3XG44_9SPHN|nr:hypothetical protein [Croceicoccus naphthovorans]AKM09363.1 hypothetical protein AB433_04185 [Croceicoccus naphthovorans]
MQSKKKTDALFKSVGELANLSAFLLYLAEAGNDRLTINQAAFFLIAAAADARGVPLTMGEIMERGEGVLTQSLKTTYKVLLEPKKGSPSAVNWLTREPDPDDERRKYLKLTPQGRKVASAALLAAGRA